MGIYLLLVFIISFCCIPLSFRYDDNRASTISFCIIAFISCIAMIKVVYTPEAIDVYQGKTTLEITYKDNVPIDSVVVFKNK